MTGLSLHQTEELFQPIRLLKESRRGSVSLVRHRDTGQEYFLRRFSGDGSAYRRLQALSSPHLPAIHHVCEEDGQVLVVEEFVSGQPLEEVLSRRRLSIRETRRITLQLCSALSLLHQQDIVHRDVKPDNVILRDGVAVLVDFDAARLFEPGSAADTQVLGTVGFAAPEQFGISQSDTRADIYALGVMLNIMLTGSHPSVGRLAPGFMGKIVRRCTMANPGDRYQTVEQLMRSLRIQPLKPWLIGLGTAALAGILAFASIHLSRSAPQPTPEPPAVSSAQPVPTPSPTPPPTQVPPEVTPNPTGTPMEFSFNTVYGYDEDECMGAEFYSLWVQRTDEDVLRLTVRLSVDRDFDLTAWITDGGWTLSPIRVTPEDKQIVLHIPIGVLTQGENLTFSLWSSVPSPDGKGPAESRKTVTSGVSDMLFYLGISNPVNTGDPESSSPNPLTNPVDIPYYQAFGSGPSSSSAPKFHGLQAQLLEGDIVRFTVAFQLERDFSVLPRLDSGRWSAPVIHVGSDITSFTFDLPLSALEDSQYLAIEFYRYTPGSDNLKWTHESSVFLKSYSENILSRLKQELEPAPAPTPTSTPTPAPKPKPTHTPSYTVPQNSSAAWDPDLKAAGPVVTLPISTEYGANGYDAYGIEIYGVDAQLMEGEVIRFTVRLLAELEFKFYASIAIGSGNLWSSGDQYGYEALKARPGDTELTIDIPLSELAGRTTLWMQFSTRSPSLDGTNADIINRARIYLGIQSVLETLSAATDLPETAYAQRTPLTAPIELPCATDYTGSDGIPSSGFIFYGLTAQLFSDNTVTLVLSFAAEGTFCVSLFEPPSGTNFGQITANPETPGWTITLPVSEAAALSGLTAKFYQSDNYANCGFLYVSGDDLHSILP